MERIGITGTELMAGEWERPAPLLAPWLTTRCLTMVHAWRGVGKTFFALSIAQSAITAQKFLKWHVPDAVKCCYFDGEMGRAGLFDRFMQILKGGDGETELDFIKFITFEDCGGVIWNLATTADQEKYSQAIANYPLVIIDNLSTCFRPIGRESEVEAWGRVQQWLIKERQKGHAILLVQHSGKSGTQRGASNKEDALDYVLNLRRPALYDPSEGAKFELHFEKCRWMSGNDAETLTLKLEQHGDGVGWYWTETNSALKEKARELLLVMKPRLVAEMLQVPHGKLLEWQSEFETETVEEIQF